MFREAFNLCLVFARRRSLPIPFCRRAKSLLQGTSAALLYNLTSIPGNSRTVTLW